MSSPHVSVLRDEVVAALAPKAGEIMVDGTFGAGGYSRALLATGAQVIAFDRDPTARRFAEGLGSGFRLIEARFSEMDQELEPGSVDGVTLDLGVSSMQLDEAERGFSFMRDGPLDMRMEKKGPSAADAVNHLTEGELADIFHILGEEPAARRVARGIVYRRKTQKFETTLDLAACIERSLGGRRGKPTHPATRSFQALRMWVNDESGELVRALASNLRASFLHGNLSKPVQVIPDRVEVPWRTVTATTGQVAAIEAAEARAAPVALAGRRHGAIEADPERDFLGRDQAGNLARCHRIRQSRTRSTSIGRNRHSSSTPISMKVRPRKRICPSLSFEACSKFLTSAAFNAVSA